MNNFFQQFKKQEELNEGLFDRIFGNKQSQQPPVQSNPDFYQDKNGIFVFGGKSTSKELNAEARLDLATGEFDIKNSSLNFILYPETEFHAESIRFNLKKQIIEFFIGNWMSGRFEGKLFQGIFKGSSFHGEFRGSYTNYESSPETFVDGKFRDTTGKGILGLPNTTTLHRLGNRKVNLITIPVDHYLQFRSNNGVTSYVKVLKRLDGSDSNFTFEVLNGFAVNTSPHIITIPWNNFRSDFIKNKEMSIFNINKNSKNIAGLIQIPEGDAIKEMYISTAPATFITPAAPVVAPVAPEPEVVPTTEPGMTSSEIGKAFTAEAVRNSVRNIIRDTF